MECPNKDPSRHIRHRWLINMYWIIPGDNLQLNILDKYTSSIVGHSLARPHNSHQQPPRYQWILNADLFLGLAVPGFRLSAANPINNPQQQWRSISSPPQEHKHYVEGHQSVMILNNRTCRTGTRPEGEDVHPGKCSMNIYCSLGFLGGHKSLAHLSGIPPLFAKAACKSPYKEILLFL